MNEIKKVSEITPDAIAEYLGLPDCSVTDQNELKTYLNVAVQFVSDYTDIPVHKPEGSTAKDLDDYPTFVLAVLVLVQDMYDTRTLYVDKTNINKVVSSILSAYRRNYVS